MKKVTVRRGSRLLWPLKKAYLWLFSTLQFRKSDVLIAFFPKTGSTWVRILLYQLYLGRTEQFTFDEINKSMPEFGNENILQKWKFPYPRLIKTHQPYLPLFYGRKAMLFVRDPRDTMESYFHYVISNKNYNCTLDFKEFIRDKKFGLESYFKFYKSWSDRSSFVIKYEDLKENPVPTVQKILSYLNVERSEEVIKEALANSSISKTRDAQKQSSKAFQQRFKEGYQFARKGDSGKGELAFDEEDKELLRSMALRYDFDYYKLGGNE